MTKVCIRCGEEKPLSEFRIEGRYYRENNKEALKQKRQELRAKAAPDVSILMREAAQMANQAFPLLSPAYWNTGAAKRVYEELGLKWVMN